MLKEIKKLLTKRVILSWMLCTIIMFSLSYLWHGVLLNDFLRVDYPKQVFLTLFALLYFIIGFIMTVGYYYFHRSRRPLRYGAALGACCGFVVFLVAFVLGITFSSNVTLLYALMDCGWQMFEQAVGGFTIGFVYVLSHSRERVMD